MSYTCTNEIEHFDFADAIINELSISPDEIIMKVEALIVKSNNSLNTNYTDSYASPTTIKLKGAKILRGIKDGYKYYNADEVLIKEVPDEDMDHHQLATFPKECQGAYIYMLEKEKEENGKFYYVAGFEFVDPIDNTTDHSYRLHLEFNKAIISFEQYLNRVQRF